MQPYRNEDEFPESLEADGPGFTRRSFLKAAGFALTGAALAGCQRAPVEQAIPYLRAPEEVVPGRALYYASTCGGCTAACGLLIKNRDGRPINLEGNAEHPISGGGLCAVGQASLLGLYDRQRLAQPLQNGRPANWQTIDAAIRSQLQTLRAHGAVRFLSGSIVSPTTRALIDHFVTDFPDGRHIAYDSLPCSALLDAYARTHGQRLLPHFRFDRADIIVSFDADFLGTWISPVEYTRAYMAKRLPGGDHPSISYHVQVESRLSLTGSKADRRVCIAPESLGLVMTHLAARLAEQARVPLQTTNIAECPVEPGLIDELANRLWQNCGRGLVISGAQDVNVQSLCNFINHLLDNYGKTIDLDHPSNQLQGNDADLQRLLEEIRHGQVAALFVYRCNPLFDLPSDDVKNALQRIPLVVSFAERLDETAQVAHFVCPDHHFLESWSDAEPIQGAVSLTQPAIEPLLGTRSVLESLTTWRGTQKTAYEQLRVYWRDNLFPRQTQYAEFDAFWDHALHDGIATLDQPTATLRRFGLAAVTPILQASARQPRTFSVVLYPKIGMLDGSQAYNPWLHELPDPISKVAWDNYACLSLSAANELQVRDGDVIAVEAGTGKLELPIYVQPGQHDDVIALALGYGSVLSQRFANIGPPWLEARSGVGANGMVGVNVGGLVRWEHGVRQLSAGAARITKTDKRHPLACTQRHHSVTVPQNLAAGQERRPMIQRIALSVLTGEGHAPTPGPLPHGEREHHADLWPDDHPMTGHRWGMVIDLNACTGCSACVIACQAENNIPVVGRDEVLRQREMHWLRIDRYFDGEGEDVQAAFQPMMCQHCGNAPCETVCPVLATVHSEEGLNQQVYNRCVGTRYCANNCPYKVRRFNWFNYRHDDARENLVLNPDVTVRSRGVMEKCTFCVQRIQEAKIEARRRGEELRDGDIQPACLQSCPARAIVFGDLNDPRSRVSQLMDDRRRYQVLAELNVRPSVSYLKVVRNTVEGGQHG